MHCRGVYLPGGCNCLGVYLPMGCTCWGVYLPREVYLPRGVVSLPGGVPSQGVYLPRGMYLPGGVPARVYLLGDVPALGVPAQWVPAQGVYLWGGCTCPGGVYLPRYSPREQNDRQVQEYYLAPNFVCGR